MNYVRDLGRGHSRHQPLLGFAIDIDRAWAGQRRRAADVVQQNFGEPAVANRAERLRETIHAIRRR